ncbi:hypothetical protein ACFV6G_35695 [Streptomyces lavendulae]|uniref:hypothetical protein n=1 Tax=Streptomyces lavendulae TaxID=1914 RepID=UPI0036A601AD
MTDERWVGRRVYGAERDEPDPGPKPGHAYVELVGGPLDGLLLVGVLINVLSQVRTNVPG